MQLVLIAIIYFTVVRRLPCSLIIYLLWPRRANVCVSLRRTVTKDKCDAAAPVPAPFRTFKKNWNKCEKNRTKPTKDLTAGIRARCERRPCWDLAVSIMEEWAVALTWGFIRWVDSGAFCRRHARPLGLRLTSRYGGSTRYSTKACTVRSSHWSNGKKCTGHRFSHYSTRLQTKARQGGWKKKSRLCFSSLKTTLSFCSRWQFKGVLGSSDSADKTAEQKSTIWNTLSSHSSSTLMILLLTYLTWRIFHQLRFLTPPLCRFGCFICL